MDIKHALHLYESGTFQKGCVVEFNKSGIGKYLAGKKRKVLRVTVRHTKTMGKVPYFTVMANPYGGELKPFEFHPRHIKRIIATKNED